MRKAYKRIEELEAEEIGGGQISPALVEHLEWAISVAKEYETHLEGELEGTISAVSGHDALLRSLMEKIDVHKQQIELAETEEDKDHFRYGLEELEDEHLTLATKMMEKLKEKERAD